MLNATYSGQDDLISLTDGRTTFTTSFYALQQRLERLVGNLPPPCPECEGTGDVVVEERDLVICGACKGTRIQA